MNVQTVIKCIDLCSYPEVKQVENNSLFQVEFSKWYVSMAHSWTQRPSGNRYIFLSFYLYLELS